MGCGLSKPESGPQSAPQINAQGSSGGGDLISQSLGDAQQAVGLIDGIYQLVAPTILDARNKRNEKDALKQQIGPWWNQAFERGRCRVPVLDIENFEKHLETNNGLLTPRGTCTADSPWGYFLHALAINPEDQILTWKPATGASWDMKGTALAMDVRGRAFCHLVNLYRIEAPIEEVVSINGVSQKRTRCRLSFGWLTWTSTDAEHVFATFEADTIPKLDGPKRPMEGLDEKLVPSMWEAYKAAWQRGIGTSDPEMIWPDPATTSLLERMQRLVANIMKVQACSHGILVTRQWLSDASSIKRRAMTNGGRDKSFLKDAYRVLAQHPLRPTLDRWQHDTLQDRLKASFFFGDDGFEIRDRVYWGHSPPPGPPITVEEILRTTLEGYASEDPGSWKGQLFASREDVVEVACLGPIVQCRFPGHVRVLDFAEGDPLWKARVHL